MALRNRLIGMWVFVVFVSVVFLSQQAFAESKSAYVDLASVFDGYDKTKDYDVKLESDQKTKQKDIDSKVEAIKKLQDELPLLAEKEKKSKQEQIDTKTKELQEFQRTAELDLRKQRDDRLKEVLQDIEDVIEGIAKQKGYDFIFNDRMLLYSNKSLDISKDVLQSLNDNYKNKKK
jgi:outer membrane protein